MSLGRYADLPADIDYFTPDSGRGSVKAVRGKGDPIEKSNWVVLAQSCNQSKLYIVAGVAYFNYKMSSDLRDAARQYLGIGFSNEEGAEVFYSLAVNPWFPVTAVLQSINPFPWDKDAAVVAGMRLQTKF